MNLEACFSQLTLDIIGKAVFNYDFDALNVNSPLIQVCVGVYVPVARVHATCSCQLGQQGLYEVVASVMACCHCLQIDPDNTPKQRAHGTSM
jgi:hypothetical protein